jgi:hypothetical protein
LLEKKTSEKETKLAVSKKVENKMTRLETVFDRVITYFSMIFGGRRPSLNGAIYFSFVT